jgi:hypothetical protein
MLIWFIIACEIGFWMILTVGLFVRFVLKLNALSKFILLCVPLLDIALLIATMVDLNSGKQAEFSHGLAAVYLGFTVVYGHSIIQWADSYISYKFYFGTNPKINFYGWPYAKYEWLQWLKALLACAIATTLLSIAIFYIDNPENTEALAKWYSHLFWLLAIWLSGWPLWYTIFPRKEKSK